MSIAMQNNLQDFYKETTQLIDFVSEESHLKVREQRISYLEMKTDRTQIDCGGRMAKEETDRIKKINPKEKKNTDFKKWCEGLKEKLRQGRLSDEILKEACRRKKNLIQILGLQKEDGNYIWIDSHTKGSKSYAFNTSKQMIERTELFHTLCPEVFFITWTCDIKQFGEDRNIAWQDWIEKVHKRLNKMAKKMKGLYVCVIESTKNQYPHIHILFFLPKGTIKSYDKIPCNVDLKYGSAFRLFRQYKPARIWNLKKPKDENIAFYLVKYITKTSPQNLAALGKKEGALTDEERKNICSWLFLCIYGKRQFFTSQYKTHLKEKTKYDFLKTIKKDAAETLIKQDYFAKLSIADYIMIANKKMLNDEAINALRVASRKSARAARGFLIYLCTNFSCAKIKDIRFMPFREVEKILEKQLLENPDVKPNIGEIVWKNTPCTKCDGCFMSDLKDIVLGNLDNPLNVQYLDLKKADLSKPNYGNDWKKRYITEEDYKHDLTFILKIGEIWNVFQKCIEGDIPSYGAFKYHYSERQKALKNRALHFEEISGFPQIVKLCSPEDIAKAYSSNINDYCDKDFDMKKNQCFDYKSNYGEEFYTRDGKETLWQQRCRVKGTRGL